MSRLPETSPFPIMRHVGKTPVTQRPSPPLRFFHFQHSLSLSTHNRSSQKWPVGRIKTSSPGTSCCLGSRVPHNQRRGWGYLSRRNLDESGRIRPVERKDVERAEKRWAHRSYHKASCRVPEQTDTEFRHTTCNCCVSKVDGGNSIVSLHRTNKRSTRLSLYGRGVRAIACYDRNRSTKLKQILQVHPCETARRFRVSRISFESTLGSAAASTL